MDRGGLQYLKQAWNLISASSALHIEYVTVICCCIFLYGYVFLLPFLQRSFSILLTIQSI
jgi:hypothetical protein